MTITSSKAHPVIAFIQSAIAEYFQPEEHESVVGSSAEGVGESEQGYQRIAEQLKPKTNGCPTSGRLCQKWEFDR